MEEFSWVFVTYLNKEGGWCFVLRPLLREFLGYLLLEEALGSTKTKGLKTKGP